MTTPELHEVSACYDNLRTTEDGYPAPSLECSCGFACWGETWEEAGGEFDMHLADIREALP